MPGTNNAIRLQYRSGRQGIERRRTGESHRQTRPVVRRPGQRLIGERLQMRLKHCGGGRVLNIASFRE